ncbi:helix-turn-helix domain-containing protein [Antrihabitans sp. YC2-6]|uniref:winged helix-turn-helix transcriptional regulator n=1 Tax=Antrihabitans sp. YC2-6 TaxID=2799498 RepID=UPI0018F3E685|nr:helix-turn-helix domain-containing protein [Antrihabitans sp. YC2-6]MBJ8343689.1 helix-turn-helix transcriptional regulator [Antrihabitans sp. YC2-6]
MKHDELLAVNCALSRTAAVLGERWMIAILRAAYFRARTFEDYQRATGIARNILTERLQKLVDFGIFERRTYAEGERRTLSEYRLTEAGLELYPVIAAMLKWGEKHTGLIYGPPTELLHRTCGERTQARVVCEHCGDDLIAHEVEVLPGPGAAKLAPPWLPIGAT